MKKLLVLGMILLMVLGCCSSCLGDTGKAPARGTIGDAEYFYLEEDAILFLKGKGVIQKDAPFLGLPYVKTARTLYLSSEFEQVNEGTLTGFQQLEKIVLEGDPVFREGALPANVKIQKNVDHFEHQILQNGVEIGHLLSCDNRECLLCHEKMSFKFDKMQVYLQKEEGSFFKDETVIIENQEFHFDSEGRLSNEGFVEIEGEKRYMEEGKMHTGILDLDGMRYHFNASGILNKEQKIDTSVPVSLVLTIVLAIPLGIAIVFFIYKFYKRKSRGH